MGTLSIGEAYYGDAKIFGKTYDAGYEPIKDASSAVIGAYFRRLPEVMIAFVGVGFGRRPSC